MSYYGYSIPAEHTRSGVPVFGATKANSAGHLRMILTAIYGHEAAQAARIDGPADPDTQQARA